MKKRKQKKKTHSFRVCPVFFVMIAAPKSDAYGKSKPDPFGGARPNDANKVLSKFEKEPTPAAADDDAPRAEKANEKLSKPLPTKEEDKDIIRATNKFDALAFHGE